MIKNFYEIIPRSKPSRNPGYEKHHLDLPAYIIIIGGSGSGKTNILLNLLQLSSNTFSKIVLCIKNSDEPLYNYIKDKCEGIEFYEGGDIPDLKEFEESSSSLIVFDDLVLEKDQRKIEEFFIRGRKLGKVGCTCIYISQSYYKIPKLIRINCRYIILKKLSSGKDLKLIINEYNLNYDMNQIMDLYEQATQQFTDFLLIDTRDNIFRKNF